MQRILLYLFLLLPCLLQGQGLSISGTIIDQEAAVPLPGAHVQLLYPWEEEVQSALRMIKGNLYSKMWRKEDTN